VDAGASGHHDIDWMTADTGPTTLRASGEKIAFGAIADSNDDLRAGGIAVRFNNPPCRVTGPVTAASA
jgi:hypothetical protein